MWEAAEALLGSSIILEKNVKDIKHNKITKLNLNIVIVLFVVLLIFSFPFLPADRPIFYYAPATQRAVLPWFLLPAPVPGLT